MKKLLIIISIFVLILSGCSPEETAKRRETWNTFLDTPLYANHSGIYTMQTENKDSAFVPSINLDMKNKKFTFSYDPLSSYLPTGTVTQKGGELILTTDDGKYTYTFRIVNTSTLRFLKDKSSSVELTDPELGIQVENLSLFIVPVEKKEDEEDNFVYWAYWQNAINMV